MGLIKAAAGAITGALADQWLDAIQPSNMGGQTLMTFGEPLNTNYRSSNTKGTANIISNGSKIQVYDNQMMMLVDGGKIVDFTAEPGYYTVDNSSAPSLFNGQFGDALKDTWNRFKFGGGVPQAQKVFYLNLQEIKGIKFGTRNPVSYYDNELDADLYIRAHGSYSIKMVDPILFYREVIPRNLDQVNVTDVNSQFLDEFISALQSSINQMSGDGLSVRRVASQSLQLSKYMANALDEDWRVARGFEIQAVGMEVSYDEETRELFKMRSQGAMLRDASVREGYVQGAMARGMEAAGSNANGAMNGFMGMGIGMGTMGNGMAGFSETNRMQMQQQAAQQQPQQPMQQPQQQAAPAAGGWACACGASNTGKFCMECGSPKPAPAGWTCTCGTLNMGKFCQECGNRQPPQKIKCDKCGYEPDISAGIPKFCPECGDIINDADRA